MKKWEPAREATANTMRLSLKVPVRKGWYDQRDADIAIDALTAFQIAAAARGARRLRSSATPQAGCTAKSLALLALGGLSAIAAVNIARRR
jgi:hypothetical protein